MIAALPLRQAFGVLLVIGAATAQVNWTSLAATGAPRAFNGHAWDSARQRLVAFGGELNAALSNTTTEWNGTQWQVVNPLQRPSARSRAAMAYDEAHQTTLLFGGSLGAGAFSGETWTWSGTNWNQVSPANAPSIRFGAAMAYDSVRQVVVMFGGFVPSGLDINDTWEWDGSTWTQRIPAGPLPLARGAHRMTFDAARGVTVLYGGYTTPGQSTLSDTWTWDGTAWTQGSGGPGSLCDQVFAYDPGRQRVLLFGGVRILGPVFTDLNQAWEWNGTSWTLRSTTSGPTGRNSSASSFDPVNQRVLMGGGTNAVGSQFADTWSYQPVNPGEATPFGTGCPSSAGSVELNAVSLPYVGSSFVHEIANAPLVAFAGVIAFGLSNTTWNGAALPVDLTVVGAPGCSLLVSVDLAATTLLVSGRGTVTWNIPNQANLIGAQFYTQAIVLDPLSPLPFQIGASSARSCRIGSP